MNRSDPLPRTFAILRTSAYRNHRFQLLKSHYSHRHSAYVIEDEEPIYTSITSNGFRLTHTPFETLDERVYTIHIYNPLTHARVEVKYWYLPFEFRNQAIPFLEFQYRSWLPRSNEDLLVQTQVRMEEIIRVTERIQEARLADIRYSEYREGQRHWDLSYHPLDSVGPDNEDDRRYYNRNFVGALPMRRPRPPTPPPPPEIRIVEVEIPVERIVIQRRTQPLPKAIGDILLSNARKTIDNCPIAQVPFGECQTLSITSCFHIFDSESLTKWQETHATCPVCRATIENIVSETVVANEV